MNKKIKLIIGFFLLVIVFLLTRGIAILKLPIFTDEAIYLRWSQIASYDASLRFISLIDGKQPLFMWVTMIVMKVLKEPLLAGRLVSVASGLGSAIGLFFLAKELFNNRSVAFFSSFLYVILPLTLFYDKLALVDSMLTTFGIWSLFLAVKLAKEPRLDVSLLLGGFLGCAYLTKSPAIFFLILSFLALVFIPKKNLSLKYIVRFLAFLLISVVISQIMYNILRLSSLMHMIAQKNSFFVRSFKEVLADPFPFFFGNLKGIWGWLVGYFSWPLIIISFFGLVFKFKKFLNQKIYLLMWFWGPFVSYGLFGKVLYPRYILFFAPALIILTAYGLDTLYSIIKNKIVALVGLLIILFPSLLVSFMLCKNPIYAKIPKADQGQFFDSIFSGGGIPEVVDFFKRETEKKQVNLYTEGTFGLLPYAVELYFYDNQNIKITGVWPLENIPSDKVVFDKNKENYIIVNETQKIPASWPLEKVFEIRKGKSDNFLRLFKIIDVSK